VTRYLSRPNIHFNTPDINPLCWERRERSVGPLAIQRLGLAGSPPPPPVELSFVPAEGCFLEFVDLEAPVAEWPLAPFAAPLLFLMTHSPLVLRGLYLVSVADQP
jgi:hypothetical protein